MVVEFCEVLSISDSRKVVGISGRCIVFSVLVKVLLMLEVISMLLKVLLVLVMRIMFVDEGIVLLVILFSFFRFIC